MSTIKTLMSNIEGITPWGEATCIRRTESGRIRHISFSTDERIPTLPANAQLFTITFKLGEPVQSVLTDNTPVKCEYLVIHFPINRHHITKPQRAVLSYMTTQGYLQELPPTCQNAVWGTLFCFEHPRSLKEYLPDSELIQEIERQRGISYDTLRKQDEITRSIYAALKDYRF